MLTMRTLQNLELDQVLSFALMSRFVKFLFTIFLLNCGTVPTVMDFVVVVFVLSFILFYLFVFELMLFV
jgi:hypothetical protein